MNGVGTFGRSPELGDVQDRGFCATEGRLDKLLRALAAYLGLEVHGASSILANCRFRATGDVRA